MSQAILSNGIDWSAGWVDGPTVKENGYDFVARYMSLDWRGLRQEEADSFKTSNVGVMAVAEYDTLDDNGNQNSDMMGGGPRGAAAATYADRIRKSRGLPDGMPLYFTLDVEPGVVPWNLVGAYMDAAAHELGGKNRVGLYAGLDGIDWYVNTWGGEWPWQTYAWSLRNGVYVLHPAAKVFQYDNYGESVAGIDVDLNHAYALNFGQSTAFESPIIQPSAYAPPVHPDWFATSLAVRYPTVGRWDWNNQTLVLDTIRHNANTTRNTNQYSEPSLLSKHAGPLLKEGTKVNVERITDVAGGLAEQHQDRTWVLTGKGTWIPEDTLDLDFTIARRKKKKR